MQSLSGRCWQILLKKSFRGDERNFLEPLMHFMRSDVRDHVASRKKRPRTFVSMLRHIPAAELSKNQHLRDFWRRSIFDFFNSIGQCRPNRTVRSMSAFLPLATELRKSLEVRIVPEADIL